MVFVTCSETQSSCSLLRAVHPPPPIIVIKLDYGQNYALLPPCHATLNWIEFKKCLEQQVLYQFEVLIDNSIHALSHYDDVDTVFKMIFGNL